MSKKIIAILLLLSIVSTLVFSFSVLGAEEKKNVLIVYDIKKQFNIKQDTMNVLYNLIHHFPVNVVMMSMDQYIKGDVTAYAYVFVCFLERSSSLNEDFIEDVKEYNGQLVWFGENVDRFVADRYPQLNYVGRKANLLEVNYKENKYSIPNILHYSILRPVTDDDESIRIAATLNDGTNTYPYILNTGNFHFVAKLELSEDILYYILADYLKDRVFSFSSLTDPKSWKNINGIEMSNEGENIVSNYVISQLDKRENVMNRQLEKPTLYLAIFVLVIVFSLMIIFLWYRRYTANNMFEMKQHF